MWILLAKDKRMNAWQQKTEECKRKMRNSNWDKQDSDHGETKTLFNLLLEHGVRCTPQ